MDAIVVTLIVAIIVLSGINAVISFSLSLSLGDPHGVRWPKSLNHASTLISKMGCIHLRLCLIISILITGLFTPIRRQIPPEMDPIQLKGGIMIEAALDGRPQNSIH